MKHQKHAVCPKCGQGRIARVVYGRVPATDEIKQAVDAGEIILGGCFERQNGSAPPAERNSSNTRLASPTEPEPFCPGDHPPADIDRRYQGATITPPYGDQPREIVSARTLPPP